MENSWPGLGIKELSDTSDESTQLDGVNGGIRFESASPMLSQSSP
jgi:hypothetical protein